MTRCPPCRTGQPGIPRKPFHLADIRSRRIELRIGSLSKSTAVMSRTSETRFPRRRQSINRASVDRARSDDASYWYSCRCCFQTTSEMNDSVFYWNIASYQSPRPLSVKLGRCTMLTGTCCNEPPPVNFETLIKLKIGLATWRLNFCTYRKTYVPYTYTCRHLWKSYYLLKFIRYLDFLRVYKVQRWCASQLIWD